MRLRSDWPVVITRHARQRLYERFREDAENRLKEVFAFGHARVRPEGGTMAVTLRDITIVVQELKQQREYHVITVLRPEQLKRNVPFKYRNRPKQPTRISREDQMDIDAEFLR